MTLAICASDGARYARLSAALVSPLRTLIPRFRRVVRLREMCLLVIIALHHWIMLLPCCVCYYSCFVHCGSNPSLSVVIQRCERGSSDVVHQISHSDSCIGSCTILTQLPLKHYAQLGKSYTAMRMWAPLELTIISQLLLQRVQVFFV